MNQNERRLGLINNDGKNFINQETFNKLLKKDLMK